MKTKRDEWACPCCGVPTDSSYCAPCIEAECGEQDVSAPDSCLVSGTLDVSPAEHARQLATMAREKKARDDYERRQRTNHSVGPNLRAPLGKAVK